MCTFVLMTMWGWGERTHSPPSPWSRLTSLMQGSPPAALASIVCAVPDLQEDPEEQALLKAAKRR